MVDVAAVRDRVQAYLTSEGPVQIDANRVLSVPAGSTRAFVEVREHANGQVAVVDIWAILAWEVPASPELFEWVAREGGSYYFGHIRVWDDPDVPGTVSMSFRHTLLGDYLDKDELMRAVNAIAGTADDLDNQVVEKFGGRVYGP
jgi:hypothetical protein